MSNSSSYKISAKAKWDDLEKLKTWMGDRKNFPYCFQWERCSGRDVDGKGIHTLTVQAEERNRSVSGADGYLMEISEKFPEIEIPWTLGIGSYEDDFGHGFLSLKEDGFKKLMDWSGHKNFTELYKIESINKNTPEEKIVKHHYFHVWIETEDGETGTVHTAEGCFLENPELKPELDRKNTKSEPMALCS